MCKFSQWLDFRTQRPITLVGGQRQLLKWNSPHPNHLPPIRIVVGIPQLMTRETKWKAESSSSSTPFQIPYSCQGAPFTSLSPGNITPGFLLFLTPLGYIYVPLTQIFKFKVSSKSMCFLQDLLCLSKKVIANLKFFLKNSVNKKIIEIQLSLYSAWL